LRIAAPLTTIRATARGCDSMKIAVWSGSGIGGTEKAATLYAAGLARRGHAVDFLGPRGPRTLSLEQHGVAVLGIAQDARQLLEYLRTRRPDVVHQHVPGYAMPNPLYEVWPELPPPKPALIETNVFGRVEDRTGEQLVQFRLFISKASAAQAFRRQGRVMTPESLRCQSVVYYPVEPATDPDPAARAALRQALDIGEHEVLAIRVGQKSPVKWRTWECQAHALARRRMPGLRLLLMEPPDEIQRAVEQGRFGPGILVRPATSDFAWLQTLYQAADVMIHASDFGESFGYTLAEAMAAGLPVIVRTTPWGDNAQVELVENGVIGCVCASVPEMARRLAELAGDAPRRAAWGQAGRARILRLACPETEVTVLEAVLHQVCGGQPGPLLDQRATDLLAFARGFARREWAVSEGRWVHPLDYAGARLHDFYRRCRRIAGKLRSR